MAPLSFPDFATSNPGSGGAAASENSLNADAYSFRFECRSTVNFATVISQCSSPLYRRGQS